MNPILNMFNNQSQPQQTPQNNTPFPISMDDPRMQAAKDYVASHGGDPKQAFLQLCKEKMLNPADIANMLMGGRM